MTCLLRQLLVQQPLDGHVGLPPLPTEHLACSGRLCLRPKTPAARVRQLTKRPPTPPLPCCMPGWHSVQAQQSKAWSCHAPGTSRAS